MTVSDSLLAYTDCIEVYDRALESDHGVRIRMKDEDSAWHFRMRMNQARKLVRKDNSKTYDEGHPMYAKTPYDIYTLRIKQDRETFYVYCEPNRVFAGDIEPLTEADTILQPAPPPKPEAPPPANRVLVVRRI